MLDIKSQRNWKLFVLCVVAVGIFLRIFRVNETQSFYGDQALDMLVATHLVEETDPPTVRPFAVGGQSNVRNSPVYFEVLALTLRLVKNHELLVYLFSISGILCIFLAYRIGKDVSDERLGLIYAGLTAISFPMIFMSRLVWQPNLIPFITFLSLYLLILARKKSSMVFLVLSFAVGAFGFFLHFSFAPFFAGLNIAYLIIIKDRIRLKKLKTAFIFIPYLSALFLMWKCFQTKQSDTPFFSVFQLDLANILRWPGIVEIILEKRFLQNYIFNFYSINLGLIIFTIVMLLCYARALHKANQDSFFPRVLLILTLTSIIPAFFSADLYFHYLTPYYVLLSLLIGLFLHYASRHHNLLFGFLLIVLVLLNAKTMRSMAYTFDFNQMTELEYEKLITNEIIADYKAREEVQELTVDNFNAAIIGTQNFEGPEHQFNDCLICMTSSQHLLLEKELGGHIVRLTGNPRSYTNVTPLLGDPKYFYMVCHVWGQEYVHDKQVLSDRAKADCLPKAQTLNTDKTSLILLSEKVITGRIHYGNAMLFVLQRVPNSTSL